MNVENIRALAARLRAPATQGHFNMGIYFNFNGEENRYSTVAQDIHTCGTTACIAGFAYIMAKPDGPSYEADRNWNFTDFRGREIAKSWLGITETQAFNLFESNARLDITPEQAAQVLDRLAETGEVSWD
jgi:hypothetical protein